MDDLKKKFDEYYKDVPSKEGRMLFVMGTQKMIEKFNTDFNNDMKIIMAKEYKSKILDEFFSKELTPEETIETLSKMIDDVCIKNEELKKHLEKAYDMACDVNDKSVLSLYKFLRKVTNK